MDRNDRDIDVAFSKAQAVLELLETRCGVWKLRIRDIPIWWFFRNRFYYELVKYFSDNRENHAFVNKRSSARGISRFFSVCFKGGIFGIRALVGMMRLKRVKQKQSLGRPIMFLSVPGDFRGVEDKEKHDIFLDPIYRKISRKSIMVERTTLSKWDLHSLLHRKDVIFFDWFMLLALLKPSLRLLKAPGIKGWGLLRAKCQEIDFTGISSEQLLTMIESVIDGFSRKAIVQVEASRMLLRRLSPKVIVEICSYDSAPMAVNLVAKREGTPIVELQHGIISKSHIGYTYFLPTDYQGEKPLPDKIMVYGEAFKQAILTTGNAFTPGNIVISGFPRMSAFLKKLEWEGRDSLRGRVRCRLGITQDTFVLTVTTQPTISACLSNFLKEALETLEGDDFAVCIKTHPSEAETWKKSYRDIIQDPRVRILTDSDIDLYELLVASDIHVTVYSTVLLEALALGIPNVIVGCPGYEIAMELVGEKELLLADTPTAFADLVRKLGSSPGLRDRVIQEGKRVAERFFSTAGDPESIIVTAIEHTRMDMDSQEVENRR